MRALPAENKAWQNTKLRSHKYLNNMGEQDHRGVKPRIGSILGLKDFDWAAVTISGIELLHRIRKGQFGLRRLHIQGQTASAIRDACYQHEVLWQKEIGSS